MKTVTLPAGEKVAALGQGTWNMGDSPATRADEIAALRRGIDLGLTLLDTAEMYGDGRAEQLIAEAIVGRRDDVFIVSKVLPGNASRRGTVTACERSLKNLHTDRIDLYLLHWNGGVPFAETLEALTTLQRAGKIRHYGVSNLDLAECKDWWAAGGDATATNQLLYNLSRRGIEYDLMPFCRARNIPIMAYSPIEQGRLLTHPGLREVAKRHGATAAQVALAWLLRQDSIITIPKATTLKHIDDNLAALSLRLTPQDLATLDRHFPPPTRAKPLDML